METQEEKLMERKLQVDNLAPDEIEQLLLADGAGQSERQAAAVADFIRRVGGIENALLAVQQLRSFEDRT